jgi:hypothetical protein
LIAPTDFTEYLTWTPDQLLERLAGLTQLIATARKELAFAKSTLEREKTQAWSASHEPTVTGRQHSARAQSVSSAMQVIEFDGKIAEAVEERDFILIVLPYAPVRVSVDA